jgi:hypothetical protein
MSAEALERFQLARSNPVMAGLAPAIHALAERKLCDQGVDARRKAGHDVREIQRKRKLH